MKTHYFASTDTYLDLLRWTLLASPIVFVIKCNLHNERMLLRPQHECTLFYFHDTLFEDFSKRGLALYDALRFRFEAAPFRQQLQKAGWSNNRYMCLYSISVKPISL